jgi:hypothetical protein
MNYWSRIFPPEVFLPTATAFDQVVLDTFCSKLSLPPLDSVAREQISLPVYLGGFGLRSMQKVSPIAWWCALAQYYFRIHPLVPSRDFLSATSTIPFIQSQYACHSLLSSSITKLPPPAPPRAANFFVDFKDTPAVAGFQKTISSALNTSRAKTLIAKSAPYSQDRARFNSLSDKSSSYWLSTPPISSNYILPNPSFHAICRLRFGMASYDDIKMGNPRLRTPLHFLTATTFADPLFRDMTVSPKFMPKFQNYAGLVCNTSLIWVLGRRGRDQI